MGYTYNKYTPAIHSMIQNLVPDLGYIIVLLPEGPMCKVYKLHTHVSQLAKVDTCINMAAATMLIKWRHNLFRPRHIPTNPVGRIKTVNVIIMSTWRHHDVSHLISGRLKKCEIRQEKEYFICVRMG